MGANVAAEPIRVFVGIKVASHIAGELAKLVKPLERLPVRLIPPADIHLTLVPPWNEADVPGAIEKLHKAVRGLQTFTLTFAHFAYGPARRRPRLLWAECVLPPKRLQRCRHCSSLRSGRRRSVRSGLTPRSHVFKEMDVPLQTSVPSISRYL
jgi:2'-5' RNA ligase